MEGPFPVCEGNRAATRLSAVLIAGPTASGKSALAVSLARRLGGVVVNADSMQVYRELSILTARPGPDEELLVTHRLYGHVGAGEAYSTAHWLDDIASVLRDAREAGQVPVIVGGTGLYFKALLEGLSPVPEIPPAIRARLRASDQLAAPGEMHARLAACDPVMAARLPVGDRQRIVRALEVIEATGRSLADWQQVPGRPLLEIGGHEVGGLRRIVVMPEREKLYAACDDRFEQMLARGAMAEVAMLAQLQLDPALPAMRALGVPQLLALHAGQICREAAIADAKMETRRYAKRQLTWLRRYMADWDWADGARVGADLWSAD